MNKKTTLIGGVLAAALLPGIASASLILDTGTPPSGATSVILNSAGWYAAEFNDASGSEITSVSAYVGSGSGSFNFDIYADSLSGINFTAASSRVTNLDLLASGTATFGTAGWTTVTLDWTPTTTSADGNYWIALEVPATTGRNPPPASFDLPQETSASTGTAPALAFAVEKSGTSGAFTQTGAPYIGLQVNAVPLPAGIWLLGSGLLGLGVMGRRSRNRRSANPQ
jgi:hypothetical protein